MEEQLEKLKTIKSGLELFRDDLEGYGQFIERNIRQGKELVKYENHLKDLVEFIKEFDFTTDTEKEKELIKLKIIEKIKEVKNET